MKAVLLTLLSPLLLPLLGLAIVADARMRELQWGLTLRRPWWIRAWWFYGYHFGLYRIDWEMKRRAKIREGTIERCSSGQWDSDGNGERCEREELHRGSCRFIADVHP